MALLMVPNLAVPCALAVLQCLETSAYIYILCVVYFLHMLFITLLVWCMQHSCRFLMGFASWHFLFVHILDVLLFFFFVYMLWVLNEALTMPTISGANWVSLSGVG